jgi:hypothetical protein
LSFSFMCLASTYGLFLDDLIARTKDGDTEAAFDRDRFSSAVFAAGA